MKPTMEQLQDFLEQVRLGRATQENFQRYLDEVRQLISNTLWQKYVRKARKLLRQSSLNDLLWIELGDLTEERSDFDVLLVSQPDRVHLAYARHGIGDRLENLEKARLYANNYEVWREIAEETNSYEDFRKAEEWALCGQQHQQDIAVARLVSSIVKCRKEGSGALAKKIQDPFYRLQAWCAIATASRGGHPDYFEAECEEAEVALLQVTSSRYNHYCVALARAMMYRVTDDSKHSPWQAILDIYNFGLSVSHKERERRQSEVWLHLVETGILRDSVGIARDVARYIKTPAFRAIAFSSVAAVSGHRPDFDEAEAALQKINVKNPRAEEIRAVIRFAAVLKKAHE